MWSQDTNRTIFADLHRVHNVQFFAGAGSANETLAVHGVTNIGRMSLDQFNKRLADSRMVVSTSMLVSTIAMSSEDNSKLPCYDASFRGTSCARLLSRSGSASLCSVRPPTMLCVVSDVSAACVLLSS